MSVVVRNVERFIRTVFRIYGKCGTEIGTKTPTILKSMGLGYGDVILTDNCEKVTAKKTLLGWKIKEDEAE